MIYFRLIDNLLDPIVWLMPNAFSNTCIIMAEAEYSFTWVQMCFITVSKLITSDLFYKIEGTFLFTWVIYLGSMLAPPLYYISHLPHVFKNLVTNLLNRNWWARKRILITYNMWRLRIGAAAKDDHHLFSTNNYVGRQTWEFDAEAGSPAEFAGMEQARRNFSLNRSRFKTSGDLLWRIQVSEVIDYFLL